MLQPCRGRAISVGMENNLGDTVAEQPWQRRHRSAISNGNRLFALETLDGRTKTAMRFQDLVEGIVSDLGGRDRISTGALQLVRRAATLSIMAEAMEADVVANKAFDAELYGTMCDRIGRLFGRLGLERKARDVTPDLKSYLEAKDRPA
jgi:hypothetical protein